MYVACGGSVAMVIIYAVMFGITVYEYPKCGKHVYVKACKAMSICGISLKHFTLGIRTSGTALVLLNHRRESVPLLQFHHCDCLWFVSCCCFSLFSFNFVEATCTLLLGVHPTWKKLYT